MSNTRELRRRIKSIKNTSQITKAMQMVAATKMRRAQNQALSGRPYSQTLNNSLKYLNTKTQVDTHPLLQLNSSNNIGVLVLSTDKGLAGALNTNIFRSVANFNKERKGVTFYTIGKKGRQFIVKTGGNLEADFENQEVITFPLARQVGKLLIQKFLNKELGQIYIIYPDFISTIRQEPRVIKLLPVNADVILANGMSPESNKLKDSGRASLAGMTQSEVTNEFLFEPSPADLLDFVLTHTIETKIYQALLETKASEHSARMIAMQNATDNALEIVEDLTLDYNQTRQESITRELLEITSAAAALE